MTNQREKLIELLKKADRYEFEEQKTVGDFSIENGWKLIADYLVAHGVTLDNQVSSCKWISVKDRLPEKKGTFLVCTKNDFYGTKNIAKVRFYDGEWHGTGGIWSNVTHWMPLPPVPEDIK